MHSNIYGNLYVMRVSVRIGGRKETFNWEFTPALSDDPPMKEILGDVGVLTIVLLIKLVVLNTVVCRITCS
jgi:hypothetical protein